MINAGTTLIFHNVITHKENVFCAGVDASTPTGGGDSLSLDGIGCVDCNGKGLLALAEQPPISKVIVCRYPDMALLATLTGK